MGARQECCTADRFPHAERLCRFPCAQPVEAARLADDEPDTSDAAAAASVATGHQDSPRSEASGRGIMEMVAKIATGGERLTDEKYAPKAWIFLHRDRFPRKQCIAIIENVWFDRCVLALIGLNCLTMVVRGSLAHCVLRRVSWRSVPPPAHLGRHGPPFAAERILRSLMLRSLPRRFSVRSCSPVRSLRPSSRMTTVSTTGTSNRSLHGLRGTGPSSC
jgi:hypothetical protein